MIQNIDALKMEKIGQIANFI